MINKGDINNMVTFAIVYYNKFVKRDITVYENSNFNKAMDIYSNKYSKDCTFDNFRFVIRYSD